MGLLHILKKLKLGEYSVRILLLGLDASGKTTIVKQLKGEPIDTISPTLGFNIETLLYQQYTMHIWDIGGQISLRSYWRNYYECTDGIIWVVDSADTRRLHDCRNELHKLLSNDKLDGATLLILANKCDLTSSMDADKISEILELHNIQNRHCYIVQCSAVTGVGLDNGIEWLINDIANRIYFIQ